MKLQQAQKLQGPVPAHPLAAGDFTRQPFARPPRACAAFSLIEIIVALASLGMVVTGIYSSWIAIARGARIGLASAVEVQRSRMALRTLEDALITTCSFSVDLPYYSFDAGNGNEASLSFVSRLSESFPRSGKFGDFVVRRCTFAVESGPNSSKQLVLRQRPLLMDWDKDEMQHPIVLARNVKEFSLGFWDEKRLEWVEEWNDARTNQIPPLIRVTLKLTTGDASSSQVNEITRVIAPAAVTVQSVWQSPAQLPSRAGGAGLPGAPGTPGTPGIPTPPPFRLPGGPALPR